MLANFANRLNLFFSKSWSFLRPRKKLGMVSLVLILTFIIVVWFGQAEIARAGSGFFGTVIGIISEIFLWLARLLISLTIFVLRYVIELGGYNGFIDSTAVMVGWVMVRDVTNMFFVVVLLLIAFGTILGIEQYEWKKLLAKLIVAAVVVNFSRIIAGIIIDAAQVVMVTFINGVAATAGGNLINMFNMNDIMSLSGDAGPENVATDGETFVASVAALTFSAMMLMTMLIFLIMLIGRMVMLWVLIVLSPIAFVLNVLPQTQKYASQWWSEFGGNVVSGPIIAFFLWLSFVTVGAGNVYEKDITEQSSTQPLTSNERDRKKGETAGMTKAMGWAKMANFAVAIGMLLAGAKMAQQLGAAGGSMMGKVGEIGKKVAMTASGLRAGRWAAGKAWGGVKKGGAAVGMGLGKVAWSGIGGKRLVNRVKREAAGIKAWAYDSGVGPKIDEKTGKPVMATKKKMKWDEKKGEFVTLKETFINPETGKEEEREVEELDENGKPIETGEFVVEKKKRGGFQRFIHGRVRSDLKSEKMLKRVEDFAENRVELTRAREPAKPTYMMQYDDEKIDALDRMEKGMLEGEKARSAAKTEEFGGKGKRMVTANKRFKDGKWETERPTVGQQIGAHKMERQNVDLLGDISTAKGQLNYLQSEKGAKILRHMAEADQMQTTLAETRRGLLSAETMKSDREAKAAMEKEVAPSAAEAKYMEEKTQKERDNKQYAEESVGKKTENELMGQMLEQLKEINAGKGGTAAEKRGDMLGLIASDAYKGIGSSVRDDLEKEIYASDTKKEKNSTVTFLAANQILSNRQTANSGRSQELENKIKENEAYISGTAGEITFEEGGTKKKAPVSEVKKTLAGREEKVKAAMAKLSKKYPVIARARAKVLSDRKSILENQSTGFIKEDIMQHLIGNPLGVDLPIESGDIAVEATRRDFKGKWDQNQMLEAMKNLRTVIINRRKADPAGYDNSIQEQDDYLYAMAVMQELFDNSFVDDLTGGTEKEIMQQAVKKATEETVEALDPGGTKKLAQKAKAMEAQAKKKRTHAGGKDFKKEIESILRNRSHAKRGNVAQILSKLAVGKAVGGLLDEAGSTGGMEALELKLKELVQQGGSEWNGMSPDEILAYIRAVAFSNDGNLIREFKELS